MEAPDFVADHWRGIGIGIGIAMLVVTIAGAAACRAMTDKSRDKGAADEANAPSTEQVTRSRVAETRDGYGDTEREAEQELQAGIWSNEDGSKTVQFDDGRATITSYGNVTSTEYAVTDAGSWETEDTDSGKVSTREVGLITGTAANPTKATVSKHSAHDTTTLTCPLAGTSESLVLVTEPPHSLEAEPDKDVALNAGEAVKTDGIVITSAVAAKVRGADLTNAIRKWAAHEDKSVEYRMPNVQVDLYAEGSGHMQYAVRFDRAIKPTLVDITTNEKGERVVSAFSLTTADRESLKSGKIVTGKTSRPSDNPTTTQMTDPTQKTDQTEDANKPSSQKTSAGV